MVARGWSESARGRALSGKKKVPSQDFEERFVQNDAVSVCLLLNRRSKTMRVIDFRAGPSHAKRLYVLQLAAREGIEKVYTVVERDEVATWMTLGFTKEANIPCFYKRSDAFILGCSVGDALAGRVAVVRDDDDPSPPLSPAHQRAERTIALAKKHAKELLERSLPPTKMVVLDGDVKKLVERADRAGHALTDFGRFGRDAERRFFQVTARGSFDLVASIESQTCFANAFLELLTAPKTEHERLAMISALRTICDKLHSENVVSCFALGPSDDLGLSTAFTSNGFRRTGLLENHVVLGGVRKDAIVWSRKLVNPLGN